MSSELVVALLGAIPSEAAPEGAPVSTGSFCGGRADGAATGVFAELLGALELGEPESAQPPASTSAKPSKDRDMQDTSITSRPL
jgi:hypothetical protein